MGTRCCAPSPLSPLAQASPHAESSGRQAGGQTSRQASRQAKYGACWRRRPARSLPRRYFRRFEPRTWLFEAADAAPASAAADASVNMRHAAQGPPASACRRLPPAAPLTLVGGRSRVIASASAPRAPFPSLPFARRDFSSRFASSCCCGCVCCSIFHHLHRCSLLLFRNF